ncbi:flavin monoamine oxidase family protein [Aestuariispira insulae]|uniref:Tryptophan 2-monooxygenase n=1 Tax=Aestuariispira insulae TaxID=1461337 RepID=A0A3D9H3Z5_9PROT|nr:NAD(P)/FAD-dependent oxidoreductase [Aestuariispira insulae]RED44219.1 monoamine oxidase [Aestuariispira insulae]
MSSSSETDIVIVGAGISGLQAAKTLAKAGRDFVILEGSHRIGGRAYTEQVRPGEVFDLGAHWMHVASQNPFKPIADKLGFTYFEEDTPDLILEDGQWLNNAQSRDYNSFWDRQFALMENALKNGGDLSIFEATDQESRWAPYFNYYSSLDHSVDVDQASAAAYLDYDEDVEDCPIVEGLGTLVARWGADAPVHLNTAVTEIDWSGKKIILKTSKGNIVANKVLLTISTGILAAGDIKFTPRLPDWKMQAVHGLPLGNQNRICLGYDKAPFGDDVPASFLAKFGDEEAIHIQVRPFGYNYVEFVNGGRFADWLEQAGQAAAVDYYSEKLRQIFGSDITKGINREIVTAWRTEPWVKGAYSTALPGCYPMREKMAEPIDGRLFFAGEACSKRSNASIQGAYWTGQAAAQSMI